MSHPKPQSIISLSQVTFAYSKRPTQPLLNIPSWQVNSGERVLLIGSSGSGKSTLLNLLSGILSPDSGKIVVAGEALEKLSDRQRDSFRAKRIGYVAQSFNLIPYLSAIDNIKLTNHFAKRSSEEGGSLKIEPVLLELNIDETHWHRPIKHLSIGQQQRVAVARAIINKPKLLIADEPTSALDHENRDRFMEVLMSAANAYDMALVFVSHDLSLREHFDRADSMADINAQEVK